MYMESIELSHREMPIDCPDGFIPEVKTRPSLPNLIANNHFKTKNKSNKSLKKLSLSSNESSKSKNSSKTSDFSFTNLNTTNTPLLFSDNEHFQERPPSYKSQNLYENDLLYVKNTNESLRGKVNDAFNDEENFGLERKVSFRSSKKSTLKSNKSQTDTKLTLNESDMKNLLITCNNDLNLLNQILNSNEFLDKFNVRKSLVVKNLKVKLGIFL